VRELRENLRRATTEVEVGGQSELMRLLLVEGVIVGVGIGATSVGAGWYGTYTALEGVVPVAAQCTASATVYAVLSNIGDATLRVIATKYTGTLKEKELAGLKKAAAVAVDICIGALAVGGGFAVTQKKLKDARLGPDLQDAVLIFLITFFIYWVFRLMVNSAVLRVKYTKLVARPEMDWKTYFNDASREKLSDLVSIRNLLTNFVHRVGAFSLYPVVANVVSEYWEKKFGKSEQGVASLVNLFWFFAEFDALMLVCAEIAAKVLPVERVVDVAGEEIDIDM